jgi:lysozyme family protein
MGNYELFSAFLAITIVMFAILLVLYLYAYQKVKHGSNI